MKEEKDDLEKTIEAIRTNLRQQEQSSGMFFKKLFLSLIFMKYFLYRQIQRGKLES